MIVDEHARHLEVRLLAVLLIFVLYEGVLQALFGPLVADNLTGDNWSKSTENGMEIVI